MLKTLLLSLPFLIYQSTTFAGDLPYCEDRFLNKTDKPRESDAPYCDQYKANHQAVIENYPDGTKRLNCIHILKVPSDLRAEFKKIETEVPARAARAKEFFKELKENYKRLVDKSQNPFLASRLNDLELVVRPCEAKNALQAQLFVISNTIVMCEQLLLFPREAMLTHLNHEIAHATDPCLYTVTAEFTFENHEMKQKFESCFGTPEGTNLAMTFQDARERAKENFSSGKKFAPNSTSKANFEKMKSCGLVKEFNLKPPPEVTSHPFADFVKCTYEDKDMTKMNYEPKVGIQGFESALLRTARPPNPNCTLEGTEEYAEAVGAFMSSQYLQSKPARAGYEKSVMAMRDVMTCALNNTSRLHVGANKAMLMSLQYEPFQKIAECRFKSKPDVCGRSVGNDERGGHAQPATQQ